MGNDNQGNTFRSLKSTKEKRKSALKKEEEAREK